MKAPILSSTMQIFIGLVSGITIGLIFGDACAILQPLGTAFIKLLQVTVLPSVIISLISGIGGLKRSDAGLIARNGSLVMLMMWSVGIVSFLSMQLAFPVLLNPSFYSTRVLPNPEATNMIDLFIPSNIFHSLSEGTIPAIVFFSLLLGFTLIGDDKNKPLVSLINGLSSAISRMTHIISRIIPLGVFIIAASTAGTLTFERFLQLQVFFSSMAVLSILMTLMVLPLMVSCFTPFTYREIVSTSSKAVILGFSTGSSFITLSLISESIQKLFQSYGNTEKLRSYSEILVPLGYTFPSIGSFMPFLFILFTAWFYHDPLNLERQLILISGGFLSLFSSYRAAIEFMLNLLGLPNDAINLYMSSYSLHVHLVAPLVSMSIFSFAAICTALLSNFARFRLKKAIFSALVVVIVFSVSIIGLNLGFSHLLANTYSSDETVSNMDLPKQDDGSFMNKSLDVKVYMSPADLPHIDQRKNATEGALDRIKHQSVLRVGYNPGSIPFAFFNKRGSLVGHDVEMAYELAHFIGVKKLEFIPVTDSSMAEFLNNGTCDIIMSGVMVTPERLDRFRFTSPYMTLHLAMVVKDNRKGDFTDLENIQKMEGLRLASPAGSEYLNISSQLFPNASLVKLNNSWEFFKGDRADALLTTAEEGSVMTLLYPFYDVAMFDTTDTYKVLCAYPIAKGSDESFQTLLNYWIKMDEEYGTLNKKYDYWILGKGVEKKQPRWCIARDVLHLMR